MNQQRSRRFRAAQDLEEKVRQQLRQWRRQQWRLRQQLAKTCGGRLQ